MTPAVYVEEAGNPAGPAILLVHGFLSSAAQWDLNVERLGQAHRLLLMELPGHGRSPAPDERDAYAPDRIVEAIESVREAHGVDRWWVVGQSLGGAVSIRYGLTHPERVLGLIFSNSRAVFGIGRRGADGVRGMSQAPSTPRELPFHPANASRFPSAVKARLVAAADAVAMHVVDHVGSHRGEWRSGHRFGELQMPTLLVNGRWETLFQPCVDEARAALASLEVVHLEGGHSINIEQPEGFDAAVVDFIRRHTAR